MTEGVGVEDMRGDCDRAVGDWDRDGSEGCDVGIVGEPHRDGGARGDEMRGNI